METWGQGEAADGEYFDRSIIRGPSETISPEDLLSQDHHLGKASSFSFVTSTSPTLGVCD